MEIQGSVSRMFYGTRERWSCFGLSFALGGAQELAGRGKRGQNPPGTLSTPQGSPSNDLILNTSAIPDRFQGAALGKLYGKGRVRPPRPLRPGQGLNIWKRNERNLVKRIL